MRLSRERNCSVEMPGSTRWSSTKRRGPAARSRTINSVHLSPTRSSARVSGDHWSYGCRFGGGKEAMRTPFRVEAFISFSRSPTKSRRVLPPPEQNVRQFVAAGAFQGGERATRHEGQGRGPMGDVVVLAEHRREREERTTPRLGGDRGAAPGRAAIFAFDLASPLTYLAAERVERLLGTVRWQPVAAEALHRGNPWEDPGARAAAERRAAELHLPLVWPDRFPDP